jgi:alpha-glucoside transport system substrate-binding protein
MMLRLHAPEVYDQWVSNELPFDSPEVVAAIEEYGWFARNDDFVSGGSASVPTTDFRDAPNGLFEFPPQCYMHKQASFIPTFFPEGTEYGVDWDFFYLPAPGEGDLGTPVLGAGTLFSITEDSEAARAFIEFLKTPIAHEVWMAQSGFLTPHTGVNLDTFSNDSLRAMNELLLERHHLPLRRVGPDARRDRRRGVLDRHGRLHHRRRGLGGGGRHPGALELAPVGGAGPPAAVGPAGGTDEDKAGGQR